MSFNNFVGMKSADQWKQKGIYIHELKDNIYPFYNVFPPTRHDYLQIFKSVVKQLNLLSGIATPVLEIGVGTGVLSFLLCHIAGTSECCYHSYSNCIVTPKIKLQVVGTDISEYAIECANFNASHLGYKGQVNFQEADIFPAVGQKYDLIVCNPPFLPGSPATVVEQGLLEARLRNRKEYLMKEISFLKICLPDCPNFFLQMEN